MLYFLFDTYLAGIFKLFMRPRAKHDIVPYTLSNLGLGLGYRLHIRRVAGLVVEKFQDHFQQVVAGFGQEPLVTPARGYCFLLGNFPLRVQTRRSGVRVQRDLFGELKQRYVVVLGRRLVVGVVSHLADRDFLHVGGVGLVGQADSNQLRQAPETSKSVRLSQLAIVLKNRIYLE